MGDYEQQEESCDSRARSSRIIVGTLSIAAIAAPAASARLTVEPNDGSKPSHNHQPGCAPQPRSAGHADEPRHAPIRRAARASELAAVNRASAQEEAALFYSPPAAARDSGADTIAYARTAHPVAATAPTIKAPGERFDYGDAPIGARITAAIARLFTAGTLTARRRSQPRHS
jgi:hypothetical protein